MRYLKILLAAMMLIMTAATVYAATPPPPHVSKKPETVTRYRNFEGIISRIGNGQIVINDVTLGLQLLVDVNLKDFAPGNYVAFRLNDANMVVAMFHLPRPKKIDPRRFFTQAALAQPAASTQPAAQSLASPKSHATPPGNRSENTAKPSDSTRVKQQNGVWTN